MNNKLPSGALRACLLALAVVLGLSALAACSNDPEARPASDDAAVATADPTQTATSEASPAEDVMPSDKEVEQFFTALGTQNVPQLEAALKIAGSGSVAEAYAGYMLASTNANIDGGTYQESEPPTKINDGYKWCAPNDETQCVTFTDVQGRDGKIVNFKLNGQRFDDRITVGNGAPVPAGTLATVEMLYAYQSPVSGNLFVVAQVVSRGAAINIGSYEATYRDPTGRQFSASSSSGPTELGPKSRANIIMTFPTAKIGGTVSLPIYNSEFGQETQVELKTH